MKKLPFIIIAMLCILSIYVYYQQDPNCRYILKHGAKVCE